MKNSLSKVCKVVTKRVSLEREKEVRQGRFEQQLQELKLPREHFQDEFDLKKLPQKVQPQVHELLKGNFTERHEDVIVFGVPGAGKTIVLRAIGNALIRKGHRVLSISCAELVHKLLIAKRDSKLAKLLKYLSGFDALILDEFGKFSNRNEVNALSTFLAERSRRGSMLISSTMPFSEWGMKAAAVERLVHDAVVLQLDRPLYRRNWVD